MPLGLALFLGIYGTWVGLNETADKVTPAHGLACWMPVGGPEDRFSKRVHYDVPGWRWLIPYPFRKGETRIEFIAGDKDQCTGETFNGQWWYKP